MVIRIWIFKKGYRQWISKLMNAQEDDEKIHQSKDRAIRSVLARYPGRTELEITLPDKED